jgi:hypothetical protein
MPARRTTNLDTLDGSSRGLCNSLKRAFNTRCMRKGSVPTAETPPIMKSTTRKKLLRQKSLENEKEGTLTGEIFWSLDSLDISVRHFVFRKILGKSGDRVGSTLRTCYLSKKIDVPPTACFVSEAVLSRFDSLSSCSKKDFYHVQDHPAALHEGQWKDSILHFGLDKQNTPCQFGAINIYDAARCLLEVGSFGQNPNVRNVQGMVESDKLRRTVYTCCTYSLAGGPMAFEIPHSLVTTTTLRHTSVTCRTHRKRRRRTMIWTLSSMDQ